MDDLPSGFIANPRRSWKSLTGTPGSLDLRRVYWVCPSEGLDQLPAEVDGAFVADQGAEAVFRCTVACTIGVRFFADMSIQRTVLPAALGTRFTRIRPRGL
jgi:hypothetical protein